MVSRKFVNLALDHIGETPKHVSFDIDSLYSGRRPLLDFLSHRVCHMSQSDLANQLGESVNLVSMGLVEINPDFENFKLDITVEYGGAVIKNALVA
jgi:arginase family enzyme